MLCKIYFLLFIVGFLGSVLSIVRSLSVEEKSQVISQWNWTLVDSLGPFLFFSSFTGLLFVHFKTFRMLINVPVSLSIGLFFTYFSRVFFRHQIFEQTKGSYL